MSRATRLAKHIERTVTGPMWHGPALAEVLDGVDAARAPARARSPARTASGRSCCTSPPGPTSRGSGSRARRPAIRRRSRTGRPVSDADADWPRAIERLNESHRLLAADARLLDDEQLDALVPGLEYPVAVLLHGIVEHGTYHGGQIALLKKA